ncbi:MAG: hypothetical protein HGB08_00915 [Candidatus Moranbacteria bacterium]|nr:hypothetical protein [Candidatus Moranbacteria bacterium]
MNRKKLALVSIVIAGIFVFYFCVIEIGTKSHDAQVEIEGADNSESEKEENAGREFAENGKGGADLGNNYKLYKGRIYYWNDGSPQAPSSMSEIDADPASFVSFSSAYCVKNADCAGYGKDNEKVFINDFEIVGADPGTFVLMGTDPGLYGYSKDKDRVYVDNSPVDNADPNSFKVLGGCYGSDYRAVYCDRNEMGSADAKTFTVIDSNRGIAKDKNGFFLRGERVSPSNYDSYGISKYLK